jgi:uncharacterized protein with PQ loop repeat
VHPERRPASTKSSSSSSSSSSSEDEDNEHKSLLGASSNTLGNNYLSVAATPVPVTSASAAGTGFMASSSASTSSFSTSPSGGISFCQAQDQNLRHQLSQDRIRYQAAQAANATASSARKSYQDQETANANTPSHRHSHGRSGRRASETCSTRTTASERFRFLQKRRSVRQWVLIILPIIATAFFIWSYVEWRNCVLGEIGDGDDGSNDGAGNADEWWGWTECGRGHGRGKLPPSPNTPSPPSADVLLWEKNGNQTIVQLTEAPIPPSHRRRHRHRNPNKDNNNQESSGEGGYLALLFGWGSAALYLGSRIPQLYKNWRLKSCEGLSIMMFLFSVFGNALFVASIFLNSTEHDYLVRNMPWWLGSTGTLVFDFSVSVCAPLLLLLFDL